MRNREELPRREREILVALVRQFIETGAAVGSKTLAERLTEAPSSATIRNVMVNLESLGYLSQPHISAGRVPTERAYRYYVDRMGSSSRLAPATQEYIHQRLQAEGGALEHMMSSASRVLSEVSHNVGLALAPPFEEKVLEYIKFVLLPDRRILVVINSKPDLVESNVVRLEESLSQEELERTAEFLNAEFRGWSLGAIRLEVFKRMEEEKILADRLLNNVATLFMWGSSAAESPGSLFVDGTAKMLDHQEFDDIRKIQALLETFEEKAKLVRILNACLKTREAGVRILIGRENLEGGMPNCTLVVAPLHYRDRTVGALGVVGPMRMEYDRAISTVDYIAHLCSRLLSSN
jgi:heat-inducible transcriptional repressor